MAQWPVEAWQDVTVLAAVSGGADSVALLRCLASLKQGGEGRLAVAHLNHQLRGAEADADEAFVRRLAEELGLPCHCGRLDPALWQQCPEGGLEAAARNRRHRFLTEIAERCGARYVAFAHTADDQIETILHRILRGTGLAGLAGMPRCRRLSRAVTLVRPFLHVHREQVLAYLREIGQPFREDHSNADPRFTRNRIRHELLPHLAESYNPAVGEALLRLGRLARESQDLVDALVRDLTASGAVRETAGGLRISREKLAGQPPYLVRELLAHAWKSQGWPVQAMGFQQWNALARMLLDAPPDASAKHTFPGPVRAERRTEGLVLTPV